MLQVVCQAQYLTRNVGSMRSTDYDATHMVKAVKGLDLSPNAYTYVTIQGKSHKITNESKDDAISWFAEWAVFQIGGLGAGPNIILLPIPSSKTVVTSPEDYRTCRIANAIASLLPKSLVSSALRFKTPLPNSREEGGSRDPHVLYPNMVLANVPPGDIVLIDDVMTSGGHFTAANWILADQGRTPVLAVACGRSLETQVDNPFAGWAEELPTGR